MLFVYVCVGVCLKDAFGTGLIISGDIYKCSHPHICIYIYIHIEQIITMFLLVYMVPISPPPPPPDDKVLIWFYKSATIVLNA